MIQLTQMIGFHLMSWSNIMSWVLPSPYLKVQKDFSNVTLPPLQLYPSHQTVLGVFTMHATLTRLIKHVGI